MSRTLLVVGANGTVSSALLNALGDADFDARAMVRDPEKAAGVEGAGVRAVVGDLGDPSSLQSIFRGVHDLFLLVPNDPRAPEQSSNALWAARQAGVERVVRLSVFGAAHDAPTRSGRLHALSDSELEASGLGWTVLRPCWFMQNLLNEAGDISGSGVFKLNAGRGRVGMIDVRDVAEFAAKVLTDGPEPHDAKTYTLTGPEAISFDGVAQQMSELLNKTVSYQAVTGSDKLQSLLGYGVPPWIAGMVAEYGEAYSAGWGDTVSGAFHDVMGRPPRGVADFIRDHSAAFA